MTDSYPTLLAVLLRAREGDPWSSRSWHEEATLAQLKSAEVGAAQRRAVDDGYLARVGEWVGDEWSPNMPRCTHEGGKSRWVTRYRRTGKRLPGQAEPQMAGQMDLLEAVGG